MAGRGLLQPLVVRGEFACLPRHCLPEPSALAALALCVVVVLTCLLGGLGMGTPLGALLPAFGWLLASLVLTMPRPPSRQVRKTTTQSTSAATGTWPMVWLNWKQPISPSMAPSRNSAT